MSFYAAELAKMRARDEDVDKARELGVRGGTGVADYLFRGEKLDIDKRLMAINEAREAREQGKWDIGLAERRADATTAQVMRENEETKKEVYNAKLEQLKKQREQHAADNFAYNQQLQVAEGALQGLKDDAKSLGLTPGHFDKAPIGIDSGMPLMPTEPKSADKPRPVTPKPGTTPPKQKPTPAEKPRLYAQGFSATAPKGFGFDSNGSLVRDPDGRLSRKLDVGSEDLPFHDKLLSDEDIAARAKEYAEGLKLANVREESLRRIKADPTNAAALNLLGENGMRDVIDDYMSKDAAAKTAASQQAFMNAIKSQEADAKTKQAAVAQMEAEWAVKKGLGNLELGAREETVREGRLQLDRDKFEYQKAQDIAAARRGNPRKYSQKTKDAVRRIDQELRSLERGIRDANTAAHDYAVKRDPVGKSIPERDRLKERYAAGARAAVIDEKHQLWPLWRLKNENVVAFEAVRDEYARALESGTNPGEAMDNMLNSSTHYLRAPAVKGKKKAKPTKAPQKGKPVELSPQAKEVNKADAAAEMVDTQAGRSKLNGAATSEMKAKANAVAQKFVADMEAKMGVKVDTLSAESKAGVMKMAKAAYFMALARYQGYYD
jgi:hypothetical protein